MCKAESSHQIVDTCPVNSVCSEVSVSGGSNLADVHDDGESVFFSDGNNLRKLRLLM